MANEKLGVATEPSPEVSIGELYSTFVQWGLTFRALTNATPKIPRTAPKNH